MKRFALSAVFWWTMILWTGIAALYLVFTDKWQAGLVVYSIGFFVAVALAKWVDCHNESEHTDGR